MTTLAFETHGAQTYRFTTTDKYSNDVKSLKRAVKRLNADVREFARKHGKLYESQQILRVRLMARGPRRINGVPLHPGSACCLQHKYANHYDVYVVEDHDARRSLVEELETGLTPGMQATIANAERVIWKTKMAGYRRMSDLGRTPQYRKL